MCVCMLVGIGLCTCGCQCITRVFTRLRFWCSMCVFMCSYTSVLNACQGIYLLVSAARHV